MRGKWDEPARSAVSGLPEIGGLYVVRMLRASSL